MASSQTQCDPERIRLLLAETLPEWQQSELAEHLARCAQCRRILESMAGDADWWSEVTVCLRNHSTAADSANALLSNLGPAAEEAFEADFVVDFLEPSQEPGSLGRLGEYEILEVIGQGGMGVVLKGYHRELARYVAVKVMAPHLASSGAARQRFVREARAAAAIVHPHVMPIHAVCTTARLPYLVMPCVACESLQDRLDRRGALEVNEILRIGLQAAQGLAASHAQGLVHRDIKPANILLEKDVDRVMLTDFGLARAVDDASLTRTGIVTGTPQYMSPEQSCGEAVDPRSDLFSLGSVLYAMCTGRPPFRAETALAVLRRITDSQPRSIREINPAIPDWLEQIVVRLHDKSPDLRIQSAVEVGLLLEQCLAHVQQPTVMKLPSALQRPVSTRQNSWRNVWLVLTALVLISAGMFYRRQTSSGQVDKSPTLPSPSRISDPLPGTAWDDVAGELDALNRDFEPVESMGLRAWDSESPLIANPASHDDASKAMPKRSSERKTQ